MDDDNPVLDAHRTAAAETLEAVSARLKPTQQIRGDLYRVVEVVHAPNGRIARVGRIWHSDLARVRQFGHALAAHTSGAKVQVADASGRVIETISPPPPGTSPTGWGQWRDIVVPPAPPRPRQPVARPNPAPKGPPTMVPPILPQALPASLAPAKPPFDLPVMAPENAVERTNPLLPNPF